MFSFGMLHLHTDQRLLLVELNVSDRSWFFNSRNRLVRLIDFHRCFLAQACYATHGKTERTFLRRDLIVSYKVSNCNAQSCKSTWFGSVKMAYLNGSFNPFAGLSAVSVGVGIVEIDSEGARIKSLICMNKDVCVSEILLEKIFGNSDRVSNVRRRIARVLVVFGNSFMAVVLSSVFRCYSSPFLVGSFIFLAGSLAFLDSVSACVS